MRQQDLSNNSPQEIRAQMPQTLSSLVNKAEALQSEVQGTITQTKEKVRERIEQVTNMFSLTHHVEQRPWTMMASAVVAGVVLRRIIGSTQINQHQLPPISSSSGFKDSVSAADTFPKPIELPKTEPVQSVLGRLASEFGDEIRETKSIAIGTGVGLIRALAKNSLPRALGSHIDELAARTESRLGAKWDLRNESQHSVEV